MPDLFLSRYPAAPIPVSRTGKVTIGRSNLNSIILPEARVSRFHAKIEWQELPYFYVLTDLDSANGTYLNGKKIGCQSLQRLERVDAQNAKQVQVREAGMKISRDRRSKKAQISTAQSLPPRGRRLRRPLVW